MRPKMDVKSLPAIFLSLKKMSLKHVHIFLETLYISSTIENNKIKNENKDNF